MASGASKSAVALGKYATRPDLRMYGHIVAPNGDRDTAIRPVFLSGGEKLLLRCGDCTLEARDQQVRRALDSLLDLLPFERVVLLDKSPAKPEQGYQRYECNRRDQRYELCRRTREAMRPHVGHEF